MILVTGASGTVGRAVALQLRQDGLSVAAMYRRDDEAAQAPAGVTPVIADFADKPSLERALRGVETLFLVCSPIPELVELEGNVIDVCQHVGVKHVVLNSALGAADYPESFPSWHRVVEDRLKASSLGHTILRPNSFHQNILAYMAPSIRAQGVFYASMGHARVSFLDVRDIARAAARILVSPQDHAGKAYELNGPEAVTYAELAERITRISGRPAAYVDIPPAAQSEAVAQMGMPAWQVDALLGLQRYYTNGQGGELTPVLSTLIGRSPITLDAFLLENRASFLGENQGETPSTDMTFAEMKQFVRDHFEEFVNRKNLAIADVNFAPEFVDHGADVPPGLPPGPAGAKAYLAGAFEKFPDIHVAILDLIAEADKVVVRNRWTATEASTGTKLAFEGIVIWRVAHRQLVERWAYLTPPKPVAS